MKQTGIHASKYKIIFEKRRVFIRARAFIRFNTVLPLAFMVGDEIKDDQGPGLQSVLKLR